MGVPRGAIGLPPAELGARDVEFRSASGSTLRGWLARGLPGAGAVVLLHGIGASRKEMLGRARFLRSSGYSVFLMDFRGHGESSGEASTYGALESRDARAAVDLVREALPGERIAAIGISMGGAAALLGPEPLPVDALVLESVYPTFHDALRDRLRAWLGPPGRALTGVLERLLLPRGGVTAEDLRPIDRIAEQKAPVLLLAGTADRYTPLPESLALFQRAHEPKEFWAVEQADHEDLHAYAGEEYERRVGAFLQRHLRGGAEDRRLADRRVRP